MKFVQIRIEAIDDKKAEQEVKHDYRKVKIDYLRNEYEHNSFKNSESIAYEAAKQQLKKTIKNNKNNYFKNKKRNMRNRDANFARGIITLSNTIITELKNKKITKKQLEDAFKESLESVVKEIEKTTGDKINVLYSIVHYDEKTPHIHFLINNRDEKGNSIYFKIKKKEILRLPERSL